MMQAAIHGRLAFDPRQSTTRAGGPMTTARLAVDVTRNGSDTQETLWLDLLAFGAMADSLARHQKGEMVSASGRITRGRYQPAEGPEREQWSLMVDSLVSARSVRPKAPRKSDRSPAGAPDDPSGTPFNDELPF